MRTEGYKYYLIEYTDNTSVLREIYTNMYNEVFKTDIPGPMVIRVAEEEARKNRIKSGLYIPAGRKIRKSNRIGKARYELYKSSVSKIRIVLKYVRKEMKVLEYKK